MPVTLFRLLTGMYKWVDPAVRLIAHPCIIPSISFDPVLIAYVHELLLYSLHSGKIRGSSAQGAVDEG